MESRFSVDMKLRDIMTSEFVNLDVSAEKSGHYLIQENSSPCCKEIVKRIVSTRQTALM